MDIEAVINQQLDGFPARFKVLVGNNSLRHIASEVGVSEGSLRHYLQGRVPKVPDLMKIAHYFEVDWVWLATGQGAKTLSANGEDFVRLDMLPGFVKYAGKKAAKLTAKVCISADWLLEHALNPNNLYYLPITGDAMVPTATIGDYVIIDCDESALVDGALFVIQINKQFVIKRVQLHTNGAVTLISDNKAYPIITLSDMEVEHLDIEGRVVEVCNKLL